MEKKIDILDVINRINECQKDILEYIYSFEGWPLYWITNEEVKEFIRFYPDDFEERMYLEVEYIKGNSCVFRIYFHDHPNDVDRITRCCVLSTFKDVLSARKAEYKGNMKEYKKQQLLESKEYYENCLKDVEKRIKELEI